MLIAVPAKNNDITIKTSSLVFVLIVINMVFIVSVGRGVRFRANACFDLSVQLRHLPSFETQFECRVPTKFKCLELRRHSRKCNGAGGKLSLREASSPC